MFNFARKNTYDKFIKWSLALPTRLNMWKPTDLVEETPLRAKKAITSEN